MLIPALDESCIYHTQLDIVLTADELEDPECKVELPDSEDAAAVEEAPDSDEFSAELVDIIRDSSTVPSS